MIFLQKNDFCQQFSKQIKDPDDLLNLDFTIEVNMKMQVATPFIECLGW